MDAPTFDYPCVNDDCDAVIEFGIEPQCSGSRDEPPSGGWAYPNTDDEQCPKCRMQLTDETYLEKVYFAWEDSCEPDYDGPEDDGRDYDD